MVSGICIRRQCAILQYSFNPDFHLLSLYFCLILDSSSSSSVPQSFIFSYSSSYMTLTGFCLVPFVYNFLILKAVFV